MPLIDGIRCRDDYRRDGTARTLDGMRSSYMEKVVTIAEDKRLAAGTRISIPFAVESAARTIGRRNTSPAPR
ncbi:hypothetical protein [Nocardia aurantiaca]|uniref:Uncharacterized protein n=1 Tax=Nocardia aurantiaca TaxID=2675850 RepID=A0A6I3KW08_9NOCA|nr:hypothetical protein [Nocardia aurantiaca]MTE13601.1 hypothetical protein [Nocardia aurantiaca]